MKNIVIFDIDGTLVESSQKINNTHSLILTELKKNMKLLYVVVVH